MKSRASTEAPGARRSGPQSAREARLSLILHEHVPAPRRRLLDLFCGAGGASAGYAMAGYEVYGVDVSPQPHYPYNFLHMDWQEALAWSIAHAESFDAIHASPPCQAYSVLARPHRNAGKLYPDLIAPVREALRGFGVPWVIENVVGAPMRPDVMLCGSMFGMKVRRHRWFEFSEPTGPWTGIACNHELRPVVVSGNNHSGGFTSAEIVAAMETPWMNRYEARQAIPPAFTEFIGKRLLSGSLGSGERKP